MSNQLSSYFLISKLAFSNVTLFPFRIKGTTVSPKGTEFTEYMRFIKNVMHSIVQLLQQCLPVKGPRNQRLFSLKDWMSQMVLSKCANPEEAYSIH